MFRNVFGRQSVSHPLRYCEHHSAQCSARSALSEHLLDPYEEEEEEQEDALQVHMIMVMTTWERVLYGDPSPPGGAAVFVIA